MRLFILLLVLAHAACADVYISKVLYDPVGTESGGEAVEIWNTGASVDIGGWIISTASSAKDATLPSVVLLSGERFLVADEGWQENRDDAEWRSADYEEKITLGNSDSGLALIRDGVVVDALGWGDAEEYFLGEPAVPVSSGKCLVRTGFSGSNVDDFVGQDCAFFDGLSVLIETEVGGGFSAWVETDDSEESGIQVRPGNPVLVKANRPANATLAGRKFSLEEVNGTYSALIDSSGIASGSYVLGVNGVSIELEILPEAFLTVKQTLLELDPSDTLIIENKGSVTARVTVSCEDLAFNEHRIHRDHVKIDGKSLSRNVEASIAPGEKKQFVIELDESVSVPPGRYSATLRITYGS